MKRSEKTSAAVASTAGEMLGNAEETMLVVEELEKKIGVLKTMFREHCKLVKSIAGSALTQAPDQP